ncbi:unnamed protein product [Acanthoscelides obtectus]|uniref:Uncharacterized protein n=1 Tax=Acanthoscelides obtectus TaxID=200917 RepID=A0A9P0NVR8_ACAOB|nr:unnamed protein product [Acanthoscelides obtectus]CAK1667921.1 hypothetical protein AOBTE_LOCUS26118 [Acanthoscelides obtectus]
MLGAVVAGCPQKSVDYTPTACAEEETITKEASGSSGLVLKATTMKAGPINDAVRVQIQSVGVVKILELNAISSFYPKHKQIDYLKTAQLQLLDSEITHMSMSVDT